MIINYLTNLKELMLMLAPWLLLGLGVAGLLHVFLPEGFIRRHLGGNGFIQVLKAVAIGIPMPLCSCGVIPAAIGLKKEGASDGAATGFLISTPQTGVDSILVCASFLGWPFAIFKVFSALVSGLLGGMLVNGFGLGQPEPDAKPKSACGCHATPPLPPPSVTQPGCCCSNQPATGSSGCCSDTIEMEPSKSCCSDKSPKAPKSSPLKKLGLAFHYAIAVLLKDIYLWLLAGMAVAALITTLIPEGKLADLAWTQGLPGMITMLVISLPIYICATASVPLAASLVVAGMSPGSALVLLMAGPTTNAATMGAIYRSFGRRTLAIYLATVAGMSIILGLLFDRVIQVQGRAAALHCHEPLLIQWLCAGALTLILIGLAAWDIKSHFVPKPSHSCCEH